MSTFIDNIFDKIGNVILPKTVTKAVWGQTSGNRLDQELDGIEAALAQPNTGTSADRAYSAGKYIYHVKNKELYKAKSNIASGAAFNKASGGNVDVVNIGDQLQTISSELTPEDVTASAISSTYSGHELLEVRKMGHLVQVYVASKSANWAENDVIATLASGYRPVYKVYVLAFAYNQDTPVQILIDTNGNISVYGKTGVTDKRLRFTATFFV